MPTKHLLTAAALAALVLAACKPIVAPPANTTGTTSPPPATTNANVPDTMQPKPDADAMMKKDPAPEGTMAKPAASTYVPFTQAAYDAATAAKRPIFLYFFATWCPICARQEPIIVDLFKGGEINDWGIAALRVNFNDPDTDADERTLADRFGISYQHTFVLLDATGKTVDKIIGDQTKEQLKAALEKIKNEK